MSNKQRAPCGDFQTPLVRVWLPEWREQFIRDSSVCYGTHISKIKQPSLIQTDSVREIENTSINSRPAGCLMGWVQRTLAGRTFFPSTRLHIHFIHSHSLSFHLFQLMQTPTEIGASSLLMNRFPFLPFLKLHPVPRKTFPGMAAGWFTWSTRNFLQGLAKRSCCLGQASALVIEDLGERAGLCAEVHCSQHLQDTVVLQDTLRRGRKSGSCDSLIGGRSVRIHKDFF